MTLRARNEVNTVDAVNTRLVEHWQTDAPSLQNSFRKTAAVDRYMDMNAIPSRLYREDMRQSQPYVIPSTQNPAVQKTLALNAATAQSLSTIQGLGNRLQLARTPQEISSLRGSLKIKQDTYKLLQAQTKQIQVDTLASNPYFEKYDVATDSRNVMRELRAAVSEDVVDKGVRESQQLLKRELENRWLPANYAEEKGFDQLSAYEVMRPQFNDMTRDYRSGGR
jgi:hypothetical protein